MRPISVEGLKLPDQVAPGPAPSLQWIDIVDLVVDETYQRPIAGLGKTNVRRIAESFSWSKFATVVVAPIEGGKFAIIDGQHRTTAAAIVGMTSVPCQVILADRAGQAEAFRAINGTTTKVSALAMWKASLAARDPFCVKVDEAAKSAGVTLLGYPVTRNEQKPGETMAVAAVQAAYRRHGSAVLVEALQCVTRTRWNTPGAIDAALIWALCDVVVYRGGLPAGERLWAALGSRSLEMVRQDAAGIRERSGEAAIPALATAIRMTARRAMEDAA